MGIETRRLLPIAAALALAAGTATAADTTPPVFVQVRVRLVRVSDGLDVGSQLVPAGGLRLTVPTDRRFVVEATAADNESKVALVRDMPNYAWNCTAPEGDVGTVGPPLLDPRSDEERAGTSPATPTLLRTAHFTHDPYAGPPARRACACRFDQSALTATVTVTATNGQGLTATSPPIVITYPAQPACARGTGAWCGDKLQNQKVACVTGTTCGPRQTKTCSGWWIFSRCDYTQTTDWFCQ